MLDTMTRILVVDDEPHIVDVVRAYLGPRGIRGRCRRATATPPSPARRANAPDLVILDVMLPRRSGFDVLRELRAAGAGAAVIMLTARDDVIDRVAGLELGADDYVTKPFEPRELVARVGAVLRRLGRPTGRRHVRAVLRPLASTPGPARSAATGCRST